MFRTRTTFVNCDMVSTNEAGLKGIKTYRIIRLASLAEGLRCGVDFLDHLSEVLVQLVEPVLQLLGKLVSAPQLAMHV